MPELSKNIIYFGQQTTMTCDGQCNKAWGVCNRPSVYFDIEGNAFATEQGDYDNYAYIPDHLLGEAPLDPGTYEGGHGKPDMAVVNADPEQMNKWCARQCERNGFLPDYPPSDFATFVFNMPKTQELVTSQPGWEEKLLPVVQEVLKEPIKDYAR